MGGVTAATPLFIALLVVETTDVLFAFDSIPAIFAITTDPFLVLVFVAFVVEAFSVAKLAVVPNKVPMVAVVKLAIAA